MTVEERNELLRQYIGCILEDAPFELLELPDHLEHNISLQFRFMSDEDLVEEIRDIYPLLLGEE